MIRSIQSVQEIWRYTYIKWPHVVQVIVPDYPDYYRVVGRNLASARGTIDWDLIDDLDYEYFRLIEFFATHADQIGDIIINLGFYDAHIGPYWPTIPISEVVSAVKK